MTIGKAIGLTLFLLFIKWAILFLNGFITLSASEDSVEIQHMLGLGSCLGTLVAYYGFLRNDIKFGRFKSIGSDIKQLLPGFFVLSVFLGLGFFICKDYIMQLMHHLLYRENGMQILSDPETPSYGSIFLSYYGIEYLLIFPVVQQLFFTRLIFGKLRKTKSLSTSLLIMSLCFSIFHINYIQFVPAYFILGLLSGILYEKTGKLAYPILFQFCLNLCDYVLFLRSESINSFIGLHEQNYTTLAAGIIMIVVCFWFLFLKKEEESLLSD